MSGTYIHFDNDRQSYYESSGSTFFWIGDHIMVVLTWEQDEFHLFLSGVKWDRNECIPEQYLKDVRAILSDAIDLTRLNLTLPTIPAPPTTPPPPKPHQGDT